MAFDVYKNNPADLESVRKISNLLRTNGNGLRNLFWMDVFQTILDISIFAVNVIFFQKLLQGKYICTLGQRIQMRRDSDKK